MRKISKVSFVLFTIMLLFISHPAQAASIKLNKSRLTIYVGSTAKLKATVKGKSKKVSWSSGNRRIATVSKGTVRGKKTGTVTITARANGKTAKCKVTVKTFVKKSDIYTQYWEIIKNLKWESAKFAVYDIDENGIYEVIVEAPIYISDWETQRKGVILYDSGGIVKQYTYGEGLEYFSGINSNRQLISERTRGKAVYGVYSYSPESGIRQETSIFFPYLTESEAKKYEEKYLSGIKDFVYVDVTEQNLSTYLGGNGESTGFKKT